MSVPIAKSVPTQDEIRDTLNKCIPEINPHVKSYEEGVFDAIIWMQGNGVKNPLDSGERPLSEKEE